MNAKHTPGPWKAVSQAVTEELEVFEIAEVSYMRVVPQAGGWPTHGSPEADARLIAAAPELLDALDALLSACELPGEHCEVEQAIPAARAAIAKATGSEVGQ